MKHAVSVAYVVALLVSAASLLAPRGAGGGGAAPGRAGGPGGAPGTVERITVHGKALEGNLEGDSSIARSRSICLRATPPIRTAAIRWSICCTATAAVKTPSPRAWRIFRRAATGWRPLRASASAIVVTPNAFSLHKGSMYSNSPTTGDWERFIAEDLVAYMDSHYRTLPVRMSRGLAGHSMGGYGALRIGMKRPDVFGSALRHERVLPDGEPQSAPESMAAAEAITTREQAEEAAKAPGFGPSVTLASAAAWSPNPKNPPLYLDLPVKDGKVRPDIVAKWVANAPLEMLEQYVANLGKYYAIGIDIGTKDGLLPRTRNCMPR